MAIQEGAFQNLVLMFLNDINATNREILKFQSRQLALLEAIKDNLYAQNIGPTNALIDQLCEAYQKMSKMNIETCKELYNKEMIMPNFSQQ
jgi:hypothetical protein